MQCQPVLVLTGKGEQTQAQLQAADVAITDPETITIYPDLAAAAQALVEP